MSITIIIFICFFSLQPSQVYLTRIERRSGSVVGYPIARVVVSFDRIIFLKSRLGTLFKRLYFATSVMADS